MSLSDTELIIRAREGNSSAFEELVFRYDKRVLSIAYKYTKDQDDAKDIYQEVFIRVYKGLQKFQFKSEFSTWLFRITTNVCLTYHAKNKRKITVPVSEEFDEEASSSSISLPAENNDSSPETFLSNAEISNRINEAVESLSPRQKMTFIMKHYEGYKIKEIAAIMDSQEGTVKKYLFEANHKLRKFLKNYC